MKRIAPNSLVLGLASLAFLVAPQLAAATPNPNSAVVKERIFNDCPFTTLNVVNNYPALVSIEDVGLGCFAFANLHNWSFSTDGVNAAVFDNDSDYRVSADLVISGSGNAEAGLRISPWWSKDVDGRFNVRSTDGEIACFGGRLPFFSFTGAFGLHYVKGDVIHLEATYKPNGLSASSPATIEYRLTYNGDSYSSGALPFDMANPAEDPPYGLWGMLNDGRVGGYVQAFMDAGNLSSSVKAAFANIQLVICPVVPDPSEALVKTRIFNDCPFTTITTVNQYPSLVSIEDVGLGCFAFANLHNWTFADGGTATKLNNNNGFSFAADLSITGSGNAEAGLRISPWWSQDVDGRFNVRSTDGEIACFGGRLPFYSFTGAHGLNYVKGDVIRLEATYDPNGLSAGDPGTIEYTVIYNGNTYSSGPLSFDMANPAEDPPHGLWGILNNARAGGYVQAFMDPGNLASDVKATFTDITFDAGAEVGLEIKPEALNLSSNGKWVTAYIEPRAPYSAADIDLGSLRFNGMLTIDTSGPSSIGDFDHDGIPDLRVKLDRQQLIAAAGAGGEFTVTGSIGGECFEGTDVLKVVHVTAPVGGMVVAPGGSAIVRWTSPEGMEVESAAIFTSVDDGTTWQLRAAGLPNSGSYDLIVPETSTSEARVAIGLVNAGNGADAIGVSDRFTIGSALGVGGHGLALALRGPVPNPSHGDLSIAFTLPNAGKATLAVFDIAGRQVASRDVGTMGPGQHTLRVANRLPAGMYLVRLNQGARSITTRAIVVE